MKNHVDEYQILSRIARGKESELYRGTIADQEQQYAIKVFSRQATEDQSKISFLKTAVPEISKLQHPNLVTLYKDGMVQDRYYYVMEFFESLSLQDYLYIQGVFREHQALDIALQIAEALSYGEEHNIIHGNLSPDNILINSQNHIKVFKTGLEPCRRDVLKPLKKNIGIVGNPQFFSPEQIQGNQHLDHRSDIFSLGVLLYRMLSGVFPFEGWDDGTIIKYLKEHSPLEIACLQPTVNQDLENVIAKMLHKNPEERYSNYRDLISDLQNLQSQFSPFREETVKSSKFGYYFIPSEKDIYTAQNAIKNNFIDIIRLEEALDRQEIWGTSGIKISLIDILEEEKYITKEQRIQLEAITLEFHKKRSQKIIEKTVSLYEFLQEIQCGEKSNILPTLEIDKQTWRCYYAFVRHTTSHNEADTIFNIANLHDILSSSETERCILSYSNNIIRGKHRLPEHILSDKFSISYEQIKSIQRAIRRNRMTGIAISRYLGENLKNKDSQETAKKWKISSLHR